MGGCVAVVVGSPAPALAAAARSRSANKIDVVDEPPAPTVADAAVVSSKQSKIRRVGGDNVCEREQNM